MDDEFENIRLQLQHKLIKEVLEVQKKHNVIVIIQFNPLDEDFIKVCIVYNENSIID